MGQPKSPAAPARTDDVRPLAPADDAGGAAAVRPDPDPNPDHPDAGRLGSDRPALDRPARLDGPR
jgi:hypothetical protein